jgi:hypothetical protein
MTPTAVTHPKGLTQDPRIVWTKPNFLQAYPSASLSIAGLAGLIMVAISVYLLKP